jgi:hypothetical protein
MKRIGRLYDKITSIDTLRLADEKARRRKHRSYGVRLHDRHREENIQRLHTALRAKTFRTSDYDVFTIYEPKVRLIYRLPYYPDRIVHHAIMHVMEPIFTAYFTPNTFACMRGRGVDGCARSVARHIRSYEGKPLYCLKMDVRKFYPTIDHAILKGIIRRKVKDNDLLWLLDEIIDSVNGTPDPLDPSVPVYGRSLPIGNYLSQYFANLYLAPMMHIVNERMHVRADEYADDLVFYGTDKRELREFFFGFVKPYLEGELKLTVKGNYQIFPIAENKQDKHGRALDYVGYQFFRRQKLIRKSTKKNFCRAAAKANKADPPLPLKQYKQRIGSWLGWAKHSNSRNLLKTIIKPEYHYDIL